MLPTVFETADVGEVFPSVSQVSGAMDNAVSEAVMDQLDSLQSLRKSELYDLAEKMLSELIPGWDEEDMEDDEDFQEDEELEEEDVAVEECAEPEMDTFTVPAIETWCRDRVIGDLPVVDDREVVDASYWECIREAERYLVHYEGFSQDDAVVIALRQHLEFARACAVHRESVRIVRTPGCP